jgi:hypothetical protein
MTPMRRRRRIVWAVAVVVLSLLATGGFITWAIDRPLPRGVEGPEAEALADTMVRAVNKEGWGRMGAIRFEFALTGTRYLWDRRRNVAQVQWGSNDVRLSLDDASRGVARVDGVVVEGEAARTLMAEAWSRWCNDSFWLVAPLKVRDPGTTRSLVTVDGREGLLVQYAAGGVTPGDSYVWFLGADGTPEAWRMWVSVLPIGGVRVGWGGWTTLPTGARAALSHTAGPFDVAFRGVEGAASLDELVPGEDPFADVPLPSLAPPVMIAEPPAAAGGPPAPPAVDGASIVLGTVPPEAVVEPPATGAPKSAAQE